MLSLDVQQIFNNLHFVEVSILFELPNLEGKSKKSMSCPPWIRLCFLCFQNFHSIIKIRMKSWLFTVKVRYKVGFRKMPNKLLCPLAIEWKNFRLGSFFHVSFNKSFKIRFFIINFFTSFFYDFNVLAQNYHF